jgi:hypothetical protein
MPEQLDENGEVFPIQSTLILPLMKNRFYLLNERPKNNPNFTRSLLLLFVP